jgi:hypothetical protein
MWLLAFRNLRARLRRTLSTAFAVALGVALIFATRMVSVAAQAQGAALRANQLAGADLEITHTTGGSFSELTLNKLAGRPEIDTATPVLRASTDDGGLALLGVDTLQPLRPYELERGACGRRSLALGLATPCP